MRKLEFTVGIDSISPDTAQFGGIQGEHNATEIEITLTDELVAELIGPMNLVYYRIDLVDGAGAHYIGEPIQYIGETSLTYKLPQAATAQGGNGEVRLVFSEVVDSETSKLMYTFGMRLYFESSFHGDEAEIKAVEDLSGIVQKASDCAERAERSAVLAQNASYLAGQSVEEIDEIIFDTLDDLKKSGEFDGEDGTPATHSWNGTVLTVTSASGTSSADLKGEKGDKGDTGATGSTGPRGEKGDKGDAYILTDADKHEIIGLLEIDGSLSSSSTNPVQNKAVTESMTEVFNELNRCVSLAYVESSCVTNFFDQNFDDEQKRIARDNIDAAKKTGDWEKLYEITTDGVTKKWEISTFADGDALALTSLGVKIVAKNPVSETPVSAHLTLRGMYVENGSALLTVMVPLLNIISTTENLVAASTVNNDRGIWFTKFCEAVPNLAGKLSPESYIPSNMFTYDGVQYPILNAVTLSGNGTLAAGNTIEIWGVRK